MKETNAELIIKVMFDCPHCNESIDLAADWDDHCEILEEVLDINGSGLGGDNLDIYMTCPECGKDFMVKEVVW